jgi:hypothetical protein
VTAVVDEKQRPWYRARDEQNWESETVQVVQAAPPLRKGPLDREEFQAATSVPLDWGLALHQC